MLVICIDRERGANELRLVLKRTKHPGDYVLMLVMRKLDEKLTRLAGIPKRKPGVVAWGNLRVTDGANHRLSPFEKLLPMAADASIVAGIIRYIRKVSRLSPIVGWYAMTGVASPLMLFGRVRELRIVDGCCGNRFWSGGTSSPLLSERAVTYKTDRAKQNHYCQKCCTGFWKSFHARHGFAV